MQHELVCQHYVVTFGSFARNWYVFCHFDSVEAGSLCCAKLVISLSTLSAVSFELNWDGHLLRSWLWQCLELFVSEKFLGPWEATMAHNVLLATKRVELWVSMSLVIWCELQLYQLSWFLITLEQSVFKIDSSTVLHLVISSVYKIICSWNIFWTSAELLCPR